MFVRFVRFYSRSIWPPLRADSGLLKYFNVTYARSSGPGGQHVNRTESKAVLRLSAKGWQSARGTWVDPALFDQLMANYNDKNCPESKRFPYFTNAGDVLIMSDSTRYRQKNVMECLEKFVSAVQRCGEPRKETDEATLERWEDLRKKEKEARVQAKRKLKDKKNARRKIKIEL
ncbi:hypothetical protein KL918_001986 [Ogataea parapolymorpha]|uniref:Peptidyl-tRNA hydrolase n=1 Tax=Ogataea parapolymorpha (strain ATCC 26012 / BCRC 20466 / JCM 22074 / NRRL Y-7560 / DL-1) TaxID=871575 RepID=W1QC68_OGAPD|nr:peptidyl-tRNA hydrolase [Ogataea parapolymorpha DL-1]ESW98622.1 peptidyl-tRNA hydrolase [Ogataea parapolymorpha DL-1]KAG7868328.1 hypothetical protein KL918_001986 [Ogataea parapolymorpha]KAG7871448.1 hypothetical protein KL916_004028 [Ogataea parapolymorpha]KAG7886574.1 hypothetical protein KL938_000227 [Ogataea parapolymorpha]